MMMNGYIDAYNSSVFLTQPLNLGEIAFDAAKIRIAMELDFALE